MAGPEDEADFRDADDGAAAAAAPPPSSPSSSASTLSKPKPAAAAGGLGKRLLAFSAAIGRPSTPSSPKPPPPPASNVGLGLLLDLGPKPSTDGSDASAHDLHLPPAAAPQQQQQGEEEALEEQGATAQRAQLALQHGEGQVVGHDVGGVREELAVLVPMEEEGRLAAEGGEKEGVADGCSENRNGFSLQDQEEEGEQRTSDELGAVMEDQEVMEKEGATKYCNAVGDQSNDVVERCAGDAPSAIRDDDVVEDQVLVEKEGSTKYYTAVEDQSNNAAEQCTSDAPKAVKDDNIVYDQEVLEQEGAANYYTTVEDQSNNIAEQCTGVASRAVKDDNIMEAQVVVEKEGATKYYTVVEDQSNDAAEQCTGDAPRVIKDDNIVEDQEVVVQEGTAKCYQSNNVAEQCTGFALRAVKGDSIMEAQVVVEKEGSTKYYTVVEDQCYDAAEQCTDDAPRVVKDENTVEDQEVVVQEGTTKYYSTVEDQSNNAAEQCTDEVSRATKDDNVLEEKEKAIKQGGPVGILGAAEYGIDVGSQEEDVLVEGQGEDGISVQDQHKVVEQCRSVELGVPIGDSAVQDQEVVVVEQEQEGVTEYYGAAVEDQNNNAAVEQCTSDGLRAVMDGNVVEEREKTVEQESAIVILGSQEHEEGEEEEVVVVAEQREDGISLQNQDKVGEQCGSDQLRTTSDDNAAQDHKVVEQEGAIVERGATANGIAVEAQEKALEQSAGDKSRAMEDESAVEDKEKVVDQKSVSDKQDAIKNDSAVGSQEHGDVVVAEQGEDGISVQNQDKMVGQCTSDQLRTTTYDNAAEDYELVEQEGANVERGATADGIAVEAQEKAVEQSAGDELSTTKYENAVGDKEKVLNLGVINKQGAIKDGSAMESQEEEGDVVVAEQGEDDISVQDQDKVVEQCINDQLRTTTDDNDAEQEVSREKVRICAGYPQRPSRPNCRFYMSNGSCSYGLSCYYNHPQLKAKPEVSSFPSQQGNREVAEFLELNRVGLPIREGARNCTYFMRNGTCRYGKKCCFNHPEHVLDVQLHMPTGWDDTNLPSSPHSKKSPEHANLDDLSSNLEFLPPSIFRMLLPPQNLPSAPEEKEMKVKKDPDWSSASDDSDGCCPVDGSGGPFCKQEHVGYSEKPGRQECPFLLRFGNCKFASSCHYYHPKDKFPSKYRRKDKFPSRYHLKDPSLAEELMVYPGKPGEPECPFYMKIGSCKFGAECKFHHPKDLPPSMQAPAIPKRSFAANEHHPAAKTMLQDHMYQQQKYPERPGEPACRYYMQFGKCKFLSACVFHHPKERLQSGWRPKGPAHSDKYETWQPTNAFRSEDQCQQEQNKPGMPECPFYMKTGTCQFGSACEFYHPKHRCSSTEGVIVDRTDYETAITSQSEMMF